LTTFNVDAPATTPNFIRMHSFHTLCAKNTQTLGRQEP